MTLATPQMLQLPNALIRRGGKVKLVDKWASRGAGNLPMASAIRGSMQHWIVSTQRKGVEAQSLGLIINGRPGLPGPLANLHLDWDGTIRVVAGGRANHGGTGSWNGVSGNSFWVATEAEGPPFTPAQIDAYAIILCAVADVTGRHPAKWSPSHKDYAPDRKVDIGDYIYEIRAKAIAMYEGAPTIETHIPEDVKKEVDMFLVFDSRFGIFWAIGSNLEQKTMIHPNDRQVIEQGWTAQEVKYFGPVSLSPETLDRIPTSGDATPINVEGVVVNDLIGDGQGNA